MERDVVYRDGEDGVMEREEREKRDGEIDIEKRSEEKR